MKQIVLPDYFRTEGRSLYHSEMGDFYGKKENFKMWHWLMRNYDKRIPDYIAYAEQYRFKYKENFRTCPIEVDVARCKLGKGFTREFREELNKKIKSLNKRYLDSLNGILKNITLNVKLDVVENIVELNKLVVNQYTINAYEDNNKPNEQWIYKNRFIEPGDFNYKFSPYINDDKYWNVKSKKDMYLGVATFGVSENRAINAYKSLNQYISYVIGELQEWLRSIKNEDVYKNELKCS